MYLLPTPESIAAHNGDHRHTEAFQSFWSAHFQCSKKTASVVCRLKGEGGHVVKSVQWKHGRLWQLVCLQSLKPWPRVGLHFQASVAVGRAFTTALNHLFCYYIHSGTTYTIFTRDAAAPLLTLLEDWGHSRRHSPMNLTFSPNMHSGLQSFVLKNPDPPFLLYYYYFSPPNNASTFWTIIWSIYMVQS